MNRQQIPVNPYYISRNHLESIRNRSRSVSSACIGRLDKARAAEERYKNYVRAESHQMTRQWPNSLAQISRQQVEERDRRTQQRTVDDQRAYEAMRDQQRRDQRAQIEQIENSIVRSRPGPKLLDSAALLADCMHVQRGQRQEMALRNITNRQQAVTEGQMLRLQNHQWTIEHQRRQQENHLRAMRYKQDLHAMIEEKRATKFNETQQTEDLSSQRTTVWKERREMERRRIQLRQTATDAMRMAEQRRLRDKIADHMQEQMNGIYLEGKAKQEGITKEQQKLMGDARDQRQAVGRDKVGKLLEATAIEEQVREERVLCNAAEEYQKQLIDRERAEVERKKRLKAQRIQFHVEEMEKEKQRKLNEQKRSQEAVITRLTNDDVSREFAKEQREKRLKEASELRSKLAGQWEERRESERRIREDVQVFTNRQCDFARDHQDFVGCAKEAVLVAREKGLPMEPFVRAINVYGRENFVEEKALLPHLEIRHPAVYYTRPALPEGNDKAVIRYNLEQLRALNPIMTMGV